MWYIIKIWWIVFNSNNNIYIAQIEKLPDSKFFAERVKGKKINPYLAIFDAHNYYISCILQLNNEDLCIWMWSGVI